MRVFTFCTICSDLVEPKTYPGHVVAEHGIEDISLEVLEHLVLLDRLGAYGPFDGRTRAELAAERRAEARSTRRTRAA